MRLPTAAPGAHSLAWGCTVHPRGPRRLDAEERLLYGLCYAARPKTPMSPLWPCRQQQQEAAARLCMLEGMLFDSEDTFMEQAHRAYAWCIPHPCACACACLRKSFMEQAGRARELDLELIRVEQLLGGEAIKRGRDRRMVEAKGSGAATPATYKEGWDRWIAKLPL
jgi:hypothetical protein